MAKVRKTRTTKSRVDPYNQDPYPKYGLPTEQTRYKGCECPGTCLTSTCPCAKSGTRCLHNCSCPDDCIHRAEPCDCKTCGNNCPCLLAHHPCTDACGHRVSCNKDTCKNVYEGRKLPKYKIKNSTIPGAGSGYFASEDIHQGQLIAILGGHVVKDRADEQADGAMDLFEIGHNISLRLAHDGAYFVNEAPSNKANAEFFYTEGRERREVMLRAKHFIKQGAEIFAAYGPRQFFPWKTDDPQVGQYLQVLGEDRGKDHWWVGKVIRVDGPHKVRLRWLLRQQDLKWLPEKLRGIQLEPGEHIMWHEEQDIDNDNFYRLVHFQESKPRKRLEKNKWWWTRRYDRKRNEIVDEAIPAKKKKVRMASKSAK